MIDVCAPIRLQAYAIATIGVHFTNMETSTSLTIIIPTNHSATKIGSVKLQGGEAIARPLTDFNRFMNYSMRFR